MNGLAMNFSIILNANWNKEGIMKRTIMTFFATILVLISVHTKSEATTILHDDTYIFGVDDLVLNGITYDVDFFYGHYDEVYPSGFDFKTYQETDNAASALELAFSSLNPQLRRIKDGDIITNYAYILFTTESTQQPSVFFMKKRDYESWGVMSDSPNLDVQLMFARFSTVPESSTMLLFGFGLLSLAGVIRKND